MEDIKQLSDDGLQDELNKLRSVKDATVARLKLLAAEYDLRARMRKVNEMFPGLAQQISGVGGVDSKAQIGGLA